MAPSRRQLLIWRAFPWFERHGLHITANHFYEPIPDTRELSEEIFDQPSGLAGIDFADDEQLSLLASLADRFRDEYLTLETMTAPDGSPLVRNGQFERVDAEILYSMVRARTPRRIVEIRGGFSTLITLEALRANAAQGAPGTITTIEPYPRDFLTGPRCADVDLVVRSVQDVPLEVFTSLEAGDILFIDSSHVAKIASDVLYEILEILPRIAVGVAVQVHDIFLPYEYPSIFVKQWKRFWNEQYLLQAFLSGNNDFAVRFAAHHQFRTRPELLTEMIPSCARGGLAPSSLWIERVDGSALARTLDAP